MLEHPHTSVSRPTRLSASSPRVERARLMLRPLLAVSMRRSDGRVSLSAVCVHTSLPRTFAQLIDVHSVSALAHVKGRQRPHLSRRVRPHGSVLLPPYLTLTPPCLLPGLHPQHVPFLRHVPGLGRGLGTLCAWGVGVWGTAASG